MSKLKFWSWALILVGGMLAASSVRAQYGPPTPKTSVPSGGTQARFLCESIDSQYTVTYHPVDRPGERYPWAVPSTMGSNWNAAKRCTEIARRLEEYRRDGLKELRTEIQNRYDIVCVTSERNSDCRIVFTVPTGKDAIATRDSVFRNLTLADSGQQTIGVNTFADGNDNGLSKILGNIVPESGSNNVGTRERQAIDLRPFLSKTDGGTATQLRAVDRTTPGVKKLDSTRFRDRN